MKFLLLTLAFTAAYLSPSLPALADTCPGSANCPSQQYAYAGGATVVVVKWADPSTPPAAFAVSRSSNSGASFSYLGENTTTNPNDYNEYDDTTAKANTTYIYKICSEYGNNEQDCVTTNSVKTPPAQTGGLGPAPTITQSSATADSISISWNASTNFDQYQVSQIESAYVNVAAPNQAQASGGTTGWTFSGLNSSTSYQVGVEGCDLGVRHYCTGWTTARVTTQATPPPAAQPPENLHTSSNGDREITVAWTWPPGATGGFDVTRTPDWQQNDASGSFSRTATTADFYDTAAAMGQPNTYEVCLDFQSGTACGSVTAMPLAPPPAPMPKQNLAPTDFAGEWFSSHVSLVWKLNPYSSNTSFEVQHRVGVSPLLETGASPWSTVATLSRSAWSYNGAYPHLSGGLLHIFRVCSVGPGAPVQCTAPIAIVRNGIGTIHSSIPSGTIPTTGTGLGARSIVRAGFGQNATIRFNGGKLTVHFAAPQIQYSFDNGRTWLNFGGRYTFGSGMQSAPTIAPADAPRGVTAWRWRSSAAAAWQRFAGPR